MLLETEMSRILVSLTVHLSHWPCKNDSVSPRLLATSERKHVSIHTSRAVKRKATAISEYMIISIACNISPAVRDRVSDWDARMHSASVWRQMREGAAL